MSTMHGDNLLAQLVAIRKARGLTQTALAHQLHLTPGAICNFESGRYSPNLANLTRYANAIGAKITVEDQQ